MGSRCILYLYFIVCISTLSAQKFVDLECNETVTGIFNEITVLPCRMNKIGKFTLELMKLNEDGGEDTSVFTFNSSESGSGNQGPIQLCHQDSQDVSLIFQKTQLSDNGKYQYILRAKGYDSAFISLMLKAPYSLPKMTLLQNFTKTGRAVLSCETTGYPPAQIHWTIDGEMNCTSESETKCVETSQGLIKITSTLPIRISKSSLEHNYTCAVWNKAENKYEVKEYFIISNRNLPSHDQQSKAKKRKIQTAVYVIVGGLAAGILVLVLYQFRRGSYSVPKLREPEDPMVDSTQKMLGELSRPDSIHGERQIINVSGQDSSSELK